MHHRKRFARTLALLLLPLLPLLPLLFLIAAGCGGGGGGTDISPATYDPAFHAAPPAPTLTEMASGTWEGEGSYGAPLSDSIPAGSPAGSIGGFAMEMDRTWTMRLNAAPDGAFTATIRNVNTGDEGTISGTLPAVRGDTNGTTWGEPGSYAFAGYVPYIVHAEIPNMPLVLSRGNYSVRGHFVVTDYAGSYDVEGGQIKEYTHKEMHVELTAYVPGSTPVKEAFLLSFSLRQAE